MRIYLASQIFAECWRDYNEKLAKRIREALPGVDLYVPQENKSINDKTKCATSIDIAHGDLTNNLDHDDVIVCVVDGDTPGIGTTFEVGYFARICQEEIARNGYTKKKIIGLYTDSRECSHTLNPAKVDAMNNVAESQFAYLNLLLVGGIKLYGTLCSSIDEVIEELIKTVKEYDDEADVEYSKEH